ncbi:unnamed protein product [Rhizophagus irregularis]|nr:unnamed protein product [Rhizophagus irregularis]
MSDIYEKWKNNKEKHEKEVHEQGIRYGATVDLSCEECYPSHHLPPYMNKTFLIFWDIVTELIPQIVDTKYTNRSIMAFIEMYDTDKETKLKKMKSFIWSCTYRERPQYKFEGIVEIIDLILETCLKEQGEKLFFEHELTLVKEKLKFGYTIKNEDLQERFQKFWTWFKLKTTAKKIPNVNKTLEKFKNLIYLEELIVEEENRIKIKEFQTTITYQRDDWNYPKPWKNEDLTDEIIEKFVKERGFNPKRVTPSISTGLSQEIERISQPEEEISFYDEVARQLNEKGIMIEHTELIRIIQILKFSVKQVLKVGFIEEYLKIASERDDEIEAKLKNMARRKLEGVR